MVLAQNSDCLDNQNDYFGDQLYELECHEFHNFSVLSA
ncbi:MAG: hypothetical protein RJA35_390 [Actinomycetota bacterium]|jgi:hypothetical protein